MKKILSIIITALVSIAGVSAVPGFTPYIPDSSGEFVYYKDCSFKSQVTVGFISYDNETYAIRYYSPSDSENFRIEKDITVYITVNPSNPELEFTGEKITGASTAEDADIVNYLHDLFYEFTARRRKVSVPVLDKKLTESQDYPQFGGKVNITFNPYVPLFNLESIVSPDGKTLFTVDTTGILFSSQDDSFARFKGSKGISEHQKRKFKPNKKAKISNRSYGVQNINLTEEWSGSMENLWFLGDYALLTMNVIPVPKGENFTGDYYIDFMTKRLIQSTNQSYSLWQFMNIQKEDKAGITRITNIYWQPESENVTRDIKILIDIDGNSFGFLKLTVFEDVYEKNRKYFEQIIKSYSINYTDSN